MSEGADPDFDRLTELAAAGLQVPMAAIALVDLDTVWFKSRFGLTEPEWPVEHSFSAYAIASADDVMVVSDALQDSRFADIPLVRSEPGLRFYAAAPILVGGERIGAVEIYDQRPRQMDAAQTGQLAQVAALASSLFMLKDDRRRGRLAHVALAREEKRHALALEAGSIASWVWDVRTDLVECDPLMPVLFDLPHGTRLTATDILRAIDPRDVTETEQHLPEVLRWIDDYSGEYRVANTSPQRWLAGRGKVVERDGDGNPVLVFGVHYDITERRSSEERQRLLLREINHRVKNTLATVQALATQTVRHSSEPREFISAFSGRLQALGRAHSLLSDLEWRGVTLQELIRQQVLPFDDQTKPRVQISGDDVLLPPDQALALGLVLHELGSNALKYGALSVPAGRVELRWTANRTEDPPRLVLLWKEEGGPPVEPPKHHGFGTILIQRGMAKVLASSVTHEFRPEGVVAEISLPL